MDGLAAAHVAWASVASLPDTVVAEILSRLPIPALWTATKASAAWRRVSISRCFAHHKSDSSLELYPRQVAESAGESIWRRVLFATYYRENTFAARLPAGDVWPLDAEPVRLRFDRDRPWPAAAAPGDAGGTEPVMEWERVFFDMELGGNNWEYESVHAIAAVSGADAWTAGELMENRRVRTECEDFANRDIRSFFAAAPTEAECRAQHPNDTALAFVGWLSDAGRAGWKAFALRVFYGCDPAGRRALLEREGVNNTGGRANEQNKRWEALQNLEGKEWCPCPGTIPINPSITALLVFNRDLSPGIAVFDFNQYYDENVDWSLSCRAYVGPAFGRSLDFDATGPWTALSWNRFFTFMFLCNMDRSGVTFGDLNDARPTIWRTGFDPKWAIDSTPYPRRISSTPDPLPQFPHA
ncbi:hypothetical protein DFJ73DRAFT_338658 [Zopfochytrium polystomum]|nr:hypothetical protein DFJ73DRAFT_338658 [Zopfochytrium polystomum]